MVECSSGAWGKRNQKGKETVMKEQRRQSGIVRTIGAFALGAAAGGVAALLFAPASGRVTRRRIAMKLRTLKQTTVRQIGHLREAATDRVSGARRWVLDHMHSNGHRKPLPSRRRVAQTHA